MASHLHHISGLYPAASRISACGVMSRELRAAVFRSVRGAQVSTHPISFARALGGGVEVLLASVARASTRTAWGTPPGRQVRGRGATGLAWRARCGDQHTHTPSSPTSSSPCRVHARISGEFGAHMCLRSGRSVSSETTGVVALRRGFRGLPIGRRWGADGMRTSLAILAWTPNRTREEGIAQRSPRRRAGRTE